MQPDLSLFPFQNISLNYRSGSVDLEVIRQNFEQDIFYKTVPEYLGSKDKLVIDVGAHIGAFSIHSIMAGKAGKVIALEPNLESFRILSKNVEENHLSHQVTPLPLALFNRDGRGKLFLDKENWSHSLTHQPGDDFEEVEVIGLSALLTRLRIDQCDLIKFNCEGAEFQIILSLDEPTLKKIGMMIILFHEDMEREKDRHDLIRFLEDHGFLIRTEHETTARGWIIAKSRQRYGMISHQAAKAGKKFNSFRLKSKSVLQQKLSSTIVWHYVKRLVGR